MGRHLSYMGIFFGTGHARGYAARHPPCNRIHCLQWQFIRIPGNNRNTQYWLFK